MRTFRTLLAAATAVAAVAAGCREDPGPPEALPTPSAGSVSAQPGRPPVVWLSAQAHEVGADHLIVVERDGPQVRLARLAGDATRFFESREGAWRRMADPDVELIEVGTPLCVESLLDGTTWLALRVFVGAACGPTGGE